ncbi:zinc finger RNA-binding protein [Cimex lectularius]|uniref:DZF domain-containing protein n=1 Tax=Cimex lectularius TaxID=79782 RepID=A0A8I6RX83_CIMLE|nr:zinc finger RNA-binding protein [Cimex lectularius]
MAANNYFGFTHGGTQYAATGTPAYQAPQTGYAVAQTAAAAAAATYNTQRAATGYDTYQPAPHTAPGTYAVAGTAAPATYDYSYARTAPAAYDSTKTYYQQTAPATQAYSTAEYPGWQATPQQTGKTAYSATYTTPSIRPAAQPHKAAQYNTGYAAAPQQPAQGTNYAYTTPVQTQQTAKAAGVATYNGSTTVSYGNGATTTNYSSAYTAQNPTTVQTTAAPKAKTAVYSAGMYVNQGKQTNSWQGYKKQSGVKQMRAKAQPKPQQLHYCEVCKISCAGPQTYREHLEGQRHKKKEALQKEGTTPQVGGRGANNLRCELCDVVCTGSDAYAAHLRGAKHQKVVKLHTRLGKPIPEVDMKTAKAAAVASLSNVASNSPTPPKINFVQIGTLGTVIKAENKEELKEEPGDVEMVQDNEVTPVGQEYIEEITNEDGKLLSFNCKLCECKFNDPNAKDMHMKGRRHRLQFKKKVNPDLVVDVKPSGRRGRIQEDKRRRDDFLRRREEDSFWTDDRLFWEERRRYEEEFEYMEWMRRRGPVPSPFLQPPPFGLRRPDTLDDRHIIAKHQVIYPKESKLQAVHKIVSHCEKALKLVSDQISEQIKGTEAKDVVSDVAKKEPGVAIKKEPVPAAQKKEGSETSTHEIKHEGKPSSVIDDKDNLRIIKGVMRVGILSKGLMLADENAVDLVVLCGEIPTKQLLTEVYNVLSAQLKVVAPEENYTISLEMADASITVGTTTDLNITVTITLTSPILREMLMQAADGEGGRVTLANLETLDQAKCLEALAQLRRAKWFQARPANNHSSVLVIRILRDLCHRNPTWAPLSQWGIELLVDKVVGCAALSVAEALRKVLEAIAGGVLLPGSCGISDPCEREPTDATSHLTIQQRADITASAQHALRLMAFRQIHKVLGMAAIPPPKHTGGNRHGGVQRFNRKRRRDHSAGETNDSEAGDGKKDKKDGESDVSMETVAK